MYAKIWENDQHEIWSPDCDRGHQEEKKRISVELCQGDGEEEKMLLIIFFDDCIKVR